MKKWNYVLLHARNYIYIFKERKRGTVEAYFQRGGDQEHSPLVRKQEDLGVGISGLAVAPGREPCRADQRDDQP